MSPFTVTTIHFKGVNCKLEDLGFCIYKTGLETLETAHLFKQYIQLPISQKSLVTRKVTTQHPTH